MAYGSTEVFRFVVWKIWNKLTCAHKYLFSLCIVATRVPSKDESRQKYFVWLGPWNPQHTQKKIETLCEWLLNCYGQQNWKPQYQDCVWNLIKVCCSPYLHCRCLMNLMNLSAAWGLHLETGGGGGSITWAAREWSFITSEKTRESTT